MACGKGNPSSHRACVARIGMERRNDAREAMAAAVVGLVSHPGRIRANPRGHHRRRLAESWQVGNGTRQQVASGGGRTCARVVATEPAPTVPFFGGADKP